VPGLGLTDDSLDVVQQPIRARMCGFGDKVRDQVESFHLLIDMQDRRPITPPPCVRLIVRDASSNKEVDIKYVHLISGILAAIESAKRPDLIDSILHC
jgi:hypothetical protein